jgi:hypothetical protein
MRYWIDKDELPDIIQAKNLKEAVKKARELLGVVPFYLCDNTDCPHSENGVKELFKVKLKTEFVAEGETGICEWCKDCIEIDSDMIEEVLV